MSMDPYICIFLYNLYEHAYLCEKKHIIYWKPCGFLLVPAKFVGFFWSCRRGPCEGRESFQGGAWLIDDWNRWAQRGGYKKSLVLWPCSGSYL